MKQKLIIFTALLGLALITSCTNEIIEPIKVEVPENISFETDIYPIFTSNNCTGCHGSGNVLNLKATSSALYTTLTTKNAKTGKPYVDKTTPMESAIYTTANQSSNHPGKLSVENAALVLGWIEKGAEQ